MKDLQNRFCFYCLVATVLSCISCYLSLNSVLNNHHVHDDYQTYVTEPLQAIDDTTVEPSPPTISLVPNSAVSDTEIILTLKGIYKDAELEDHATKVK